jgi:hypothetical protein
MSKLKVVVLYDRVLVDEEESSSASEKSPVTRTLDKKEVEEEVAEALGKLGHDAVMHELDVRPLEIISIRPASDLPGNPFAGFIEPQLRDAYISSGQEAAAAVLSSLSP